MHGVDNNADFFRAPMQQILSQSSASITSKRGVSCVSLNSINSSILLTKYSDQWLVVMSTQLMGFSLGGVARRFLVSPPSMSEQKGQIM